MLSAFSIFDPKKVPSLLLMSYLYMETVQFKLSLDSFGRDLPAKSLKGTEFEKAAILFWPQYRVEKVSSAPY